MKYIILKDFTDKYDNSIKYKKDDIEDFSKERAKEILSVDKLIKKVEKTSKSNRVVE